MIFFHVYNEECFNGLEINGLINKDSGFKIQHAFSVPLERQFNTFAAEGTKLYDLIKDNNYPFYVDRIAGGITYYPYKFDFNLIEKYKQILGDWFLGFQLHESASNRRYSDWYPIVSRMESKGPYDPDKLRKALQSHYAKSHDGTPLYDLSHDTPEFYAKLKYADSYEDYIKEVSDMFRRRLNDTANNILPCDSYYLFTKLQDEMGMKTFMPEVGSQIPFMRISVALARGMARSSGKTWGTYYECWRPMTEVSGFSMPCYNHDSINEWYLNQQIHPDDFTSYGENGGSSRLLQNRIYYHALMSGAHYFSEEWGLNCSYTNMKTFELSPYGKIKKDFINTAEKLRGIQAVTPFAIVLPRKYLCVELPEPFETSTYNSFFGNGNHRDVYMRSYLNSEDKEYFGHIEDVIKLIFGSYGKKYGNEGHVLTNSRFGDLFDLIYEDADDKTLDSYEYLIDTTKNDSFITSKKNSRSNILSSKDLSELEEKIHILEKSCMFCFVDGLHWLVSVDENRNNYLSIFNNEGNERNSSYGDKIDKQADHTVKITFKNKTQPCIIKTTDPQIKLEKIDTVNYAITIPAAGFIILKF